VGNIVTNKDVRDFEPREDDLFKKPSDHSGVIGRVSKGFHPFGHIIYNDQDIFVALRGWERSYEIHILNIEDLDLKNVVEGYFIPP